MSDADVCSEVRVVPGSPAAPAPAAGAHRQCLTVVLPAAPGRALLAQQLLAEVVDLWGLPRVRSQLWLAAAAGLLAGAEELELCVQLDRISQLVTVELWSAAEVVFGLDDWVGI